MNRSLQSHTTALKLIISGALLLGTSAQLNAAQFTFVYTDTFTTVDSVYLASAGSPTFFTGNTPFRVVATFESSAPAFHLPGFNAYVPTSAVLTVGNNSYNMTDADVSIFDSTNPFTPGRYAAGFIQNPALDQTGFVADFSSVTTDFLVGNMVPTTFTGYNGTGFQPGSGIPRGCAATDSCTGYNNTPIHLIAQDGTAYLLTLGPRDSGPNPAATAAILTPEPSAFAFVGLVGLFFCRRFYRVGPLTQGTTFTE